MPKPISLKKHIQPGVIIKTKFLLLEVKELYFDCFVGVNHKGDLLIIKYDNPNMTVYQRIADNCLPF